MRQLILALILALLPLTTRPATAGTPNRTLHERMLWPTVRIRTATGIGSGVIVRSRLDGRTYLNTVLTVAHVVAVKPGEMPVIESHGYRDWSRVERVNAFAVERIAYLDRKADAAILTFRSALKMPTAIVDFSPRLYIGNPLAKVGCGLGQSPRYDRGHVSGLNVRISATEAPVIRISAATYAGDSGGPVFHEGKLIALTDAVAVRNDLGLPSTTEFIGYAIPIGEIFGPDDLE